MHFLKETGKRQCGKDAVPSADFYTRPAAFNLEEYKNYDPDYNMAIMDFFNDTDWQSHEGSD